MIGGQASERLSYTQQMESLDPAILAELPPWLRGQLRWEGEAVEAERLRKAARERKSQQFSSPSSMRFPEVGSATCSHLQSDLASGSTGREELGQNISGNPRASSDDRGQSQSGEQNQRGNGQGEDEEPRRPEYFGPYL